MKTFADSTENKPIVAKNVDEFKFAEK